jgi:hypothetical protein
MKGERGGEIISAIGALFGIGKRRVSESSFRCTTKGEEGEELMLDIRF